MVVLDRMYGCIRLLIGVMGHFLTGVVNLTQCIDGFGVETEVRRVFLMLVDRSGDRVEE